MLGMTVLVNAINPNPKPETGVSAYAIASINDYNKRHAHPDVVYHLTVLSFELKY
jgi:hypothetical protein